MEKKTPATAAEPSTEEWMTVGAFTADRFNLLQSVNRLTWRFFGSCRFPPWQALRRRLPVTELRAEKGAEVVRGTGNLRFPLDFTYHRCPQITSLDITTVIPYYKVRK